MIKNKLQKKINNRIKFGFISGLFVVTAMGIFSYFSTVKSLQLAQSVVHANEVLIALKDILSTIRGAESGQRGYFITQEVSYLEPYVMAVETINSQIVNLKNLMNESKDFNDKIDFIEKNIEHKLNELRFTIELYEKGKTKEAIQIVKDGDGKKYTLNIRNTIKEIEAKENRILEQTAKKSHESAVLTKIILFLGSFFAFLVTILSFLGINHALDANSIAQIKLDAYTKKLESNNNNMEQFTIAISHDLQEPLRKIQTFSDKMMNDQKKVLNIEGVESLNKIQDAASLMRNLLDSILSYFSVTNKVNNFAPILLKEVIEKVVFDFAEKIKIIGAFIEVENLPLIDADLSQMSQLFNQLIGNSLKFRKNNEKSVIKIYGNTIEYENEMYSEVYIEDNGIGFDEKYLTKLFSVFQRLHSRSEFEGIGMGLAICKRIIESHNGFISAKSTIDKGTIIIITLPIKQTNINSFIGETI